MPSFSETCETSSSARTAKPWFWTVTSTRPVARSRTGWFAPRWPNGSLNVSWPSASPRSWWPRQMPNSGTCAEQVADRLDRADEHGRVAGAVRDQHRARPRRRGSRRRPTSRGTTSTSSPAAASRRGIERFQPRSTTTTRGPAPTAYGSRVPTCAVERPAVDRRLRERARVELLDRRVAERAAQRRRRRGSCRTSVARVDARRARRRRGSRSHAANAGRAVAHDDALALHALRLHPRLVDAVVADQRVREAEHLRDVARVGDRLLVAGHRGREAGLAGGDARRADRRRPGRRCRPRARVAAA